MMIPKISTKFDMNVKGSATGFVKSLKKSPYIDPDHKNYDFIDLDKKKKTRATIP